MGRLKHPKMVDIKDILDENTRLPSLVAASAEKLLGLERLNRAYAVSYTHLTLPTICSV